MREVAGWAAVSDGSAALDPPLGDLDPDAGAARGVAVDRDPPAGGLADALDDAQAQAEAFAVFACRVAQPRRGALPGIESAPVIGNAQRTVAPVDGHPRTATVADRVAQQVDQHDPQRVPVTDSSRRG